ncbi:MAG: alpha/beta fold hydrolase [Gammaproteobacteria bacterium]
MKLVLLTCLFFMLGGCTNVLFQPVRQAIFKPEEQGIDVNDLYINSGQGIRLHGWHLPAQKSLKGTVLFLHGNGENITTHVGSVYWLPAQGYEVYLFDYRGYGQSSGIPDIDGVVNDARSMLEYAIDRSQSSKTKLIVLGHSLGGSISIPATAGLADKQKITALITANAFSDYRQITRDVLSQHWLTNFLRWPLSFLISNHYRPLEMVADISPVPLYVLHSDEDEMIPSYHATALYQTALQPKYLLKTVGGHNQNFSLQKNRTLLLKILQDLQAR